MIKYFLSIFANGGPVMIPLFFTAAFMLYFTFERLIFFSRAKQGTVNLSAHSLKRNIGAIAALTAAAPLLGLLGTVNGMIETFDVISAAGTGEVASLSGGISKALITTETGLIIAIPGLFAVSRFKSAAERLTRGIIVKSS